MPRWKKWNLLSQLRRESNGLPHTQPAENHAEKNSSYLQVIICPSSNPSTKFLWIIHFGIAFSSPCPEQWSNASPISGADIKKKIFFKKSCFFGRWRRQVVWYFSDRRNHGLSKEALCRGTEGSCLFVGGVSSSGATEHIPGKAPWRIALFVVDAGSKALLCMCPVL